MASEGGSTRGALARLGLARPEARAWALYDWANSAMVTVVITAVFPVWYTRVVAGDLGEGRPLAVFGWATTAALLLVAVLAPVLGVVADRARLKKPLLGAFLALGASSTAMLATVGPGEWFLGALWFVLANVGAAGSFVFYDALLPHVAADDELDRLSTSGYALGYLGGGIVLALVLGLLRHPGLLGAGADGDTAVRAGFVLVALWWTGFSLPLFRRVPEPPAAGGERVPRRPVALARIAFGGVRRSLRDLFAFPAAAWMLAAFLVYNDGIATIIRMATAYGQDLGIGTDQLLGTILFVQFAGIPFTLLFGRLARRLGTRPAIHLALGVYALTAFVAWRMAAAWQFWLLGLLVAMVQGGAQGLSRSLFASLVPRDRSAEFFGLFAVLDRFAGVAGPALFALVLSLTGSSRAAILPVLAFFAVGAWLLARVDVEGGRARAREAERAARAGVGAEAPEP